MLEKLDLKDRKLLSSIEMDARTPLTQLAKKLKLSKQVVKYRMDRLQKENLIQSYYAVIDLNKLKQTIYVVYFKLANITSSIEQTWYNKLNSDKAVMGFSKNSGNFDLTIVIKALNNHELNEVITRITKGQGQFITRKIITSEIESTYFNLNIIYDEAKSFEASTSDNQDVHINVDALDYKIIQEMSNCRTNLATIANKLKISANSVKNRLRKLEKEKIIICYKTKINYEKLGYLHFRAILRIFDFDDKTYLRLKEFLKMQGHTESISKYIGYGDIDFRFYVQDMSQYQEFMTHLKDSFPKEITEIEAMQIFDWKSIRYVL